MNNTVVSTLYYTYRHTLPFSWEEVQCMKGEGNYTTFLLTNGERFLSSKSLCVYEPHLPAQFIRVHKGYLVHKSYIAGLDQTRRSILLTDGTEIKAARRRWAMVKSIFH